MFRSVSLMFAAFCVPVVVPLPEKTASESTGVVAAPDGRELFTREWIADDPRSHGGDGLGPIFNDSSCVACHSLGGVGGAGANNKNVLILTQTQAKPKPVSFVLHHSSTDSEYAKWRAEHAPPMLMMSGSLRIPMQSLPRQQVLNRLVTSRGLAAGNSVTQRNTTALFGAGLIDQIPDHVIIAAAERRFENFPKVSGRVARGSQGQVGRFGWKAQMDRLERFVLTACRVEMGLQLEDGDQAPKPHDANYKPPGIDLDTQGCDALVGFVASIPRPTETVPQHTAIAAHLAAGKELFNKVGCATCHTEQLGDVKGLYSDLLLHDLGPRLADVGSSYGVFRHPGQQTQAEPPVQQKKRPTTAATTTEWRTPPLWGVRDSGPYLHDGRAQTLEVAIALHEGEAIDSRDAYNKLSAGDKKQLTDFLRSLVAPAQ